jgi:hypothetical protein
MRDSQVCCHRTVTGAPLAFWPTMILNETLLCDECGEPMTPGEWGARGLLHGRDLCPACEAQLEGDSEPVERLIGHRRAA